MVDYIIVEPNILTDSLQRCYKLPFVATEALCCDSDHIKQAIFPPMNPASLPSAPQTQGGLQSVGTIGFLQQQVFQEHYRILSRLFSFVTCPG